MIRILCTLTLFLMASAMVAGCADDRNRQRSGYSYENVEMPQQSGQQSRFDEPRSPASQDPYSRSGPGRY